MIQQETEIKKFQDFIIKYKAKLKGSYRKISRDTGIHFNTIYNYMDGFYPDPEKRAAIMEAAKKYIKS